jgi:hypothetical protein
MNRPETIIERRGRRAVKVYIIEDNDHRADYSRAKGGFKVSRLTRNSAGVLEREPQRRLTERELPPAARRAFRG